MFTIPGVGTKGFVKYVKEQAREEEKNGNILKTGEIDSGERKNPRE